jgi:hypothetical protein
LSYKTFFKKDHSKGPFDSYGNDFVPLDDDDGGQIDSDQEQEVNTKIDSVKTKGMVDHMTFSTVLSDEEKKDFK